MELKNDFIVALRSVSERTEKECYNSIHSQVKDQSIIYIINRSPFKSALEYSFELALENKTKWLLTADADTILLPDTLRNFFIIAESMPDNFLQVQGRILDKITGSVRRGGPRIYRVEHLNKALELLKLSEDTIRPEQNIISKMGAMRYPSRYINPVLCIHDFEQYYRDIYRNSFVHAKKHINLLPDIFTNAIMLKNSGDEDYKFIIKGITDGIFGEKEQFINDKLYLDDANKAIQEFGLSEKDELKTTIDVKTILENYSFSKNDLSFEKITYKDIPDKRPAISKIINKKGYIYGSINILGLLLKKTGELLVNKS